MRTYFGKILLFALLISVTACGGPNPNQTMVENENPPADQNNPPIAEENPNQGMPEDFGDQIILKIKASEILDQVNDKSDLEKAIAIHAAFLNPDLNTEQKKPSLNKDTQALVQEAWDDFLGYDDLSSFREAIKNDPQPTLNKFLQFVRYTYFKQGADDINVKIFNNVGDFNLGAFQELKAAFEDLNSLSPYGGVQHLEAFRNHITELKQSTAFLRIITVAVAKLYGIEEFFAKVDGNDPKFKGMQDEFTNDLTGVVLDRFLHVNIYPMNDSYVCPTNPSCKKYQDKVWDAYLTMQELFPILLKNASFKMEDAQGKVHYFSLFSFANLGNAQNMFTLGRGRYGVHQTEDVVFVKNGELPIYF